MSATDLTVADPSCGHQSDTAQPGPALSGPALSGPALSGPALSGPALSGPAQTGTNHAADEVPAATEDHDEQRARALIAAGVDKDTAATQAGDDTALFARSLAQLAQRGRALLELVEAYDGNVYRLLRDLGDHLNLSLAYIDRATVDAHIERTLTGSEWASVTGHFTALDFDDYVGEQGTFRTAWIQTVLDKAGVSSQNLVDDAAAPTDHTASRGSHTQVQS